MEERFYKRYESFKRSLDALAEARQRDMSDSFVFHDSLNICEVKVDQARYIDQVGNTLYCLLKNFVCLL